MNNKSQELRLRVWGDFACFTRPEMKVERVSYDVMTPSAARNILQAILWKPSIDWEITRIDVIKPIKWVSIRRNELGDVIRMGSVSNVMKKGVGSLGIFIEEERQQRAGLFLRDVEYVIHGRLLLTPKSGPEENLTKFVEMFKRRAEKGQCFVQPYLGCREFSAYFELLSDNSQEVNCISDTKDLGWMLFDMDYAVDSIGPAFFHAKLEDGRLQVPPVTSEEVRR